jgi:hypothetical protein
VFLLLIAVASGCGGKSADLPVAGGPLVGHGSDRTAAATSTPSPLTPTSLTPTSPTPTTTVITVAGEGLDLAQRNLRDRLAADLFLSCDPAPKEETAGIEAAINCRVRQAGPDQNPLILKFATHQDMLDWGARESSYVPSNTSDCPVGKYVGTWKNDAGVVSGQLACFWTTDHDLKHLRIAWTFTDEDVAVLADGASGQAVYGWWLKYAYLLAG